MLGWFCLHCNQGQVREEPDSFLWTGGVGSLSNDGLVRYLW